MAGEAGEIGAGVPIEVGALRGFGGDGIAEVAHGVMVAGDVPAAPSLFERAVVACEFGAGGEDGISLGVGVD